MSEQTRTYESIQVRLDLTEKLDIGLQLARELQAIDELEERKTAYTSELNGQVKVIRERVSSLKTRLNNGYVMQDVEVVCIMDEPVQGMKRIVRADSGTLIREEPMTDKEKQRGFGF